MSVDIDGVPCEVVRSSFSEVKCVTGAALEGHAAVSEDGTYPTVQEGYRFKGETHSTVLVRGFCCNGSSSVNDSAENHFM